MINKELEYPVTSCLYVAKTFQFYVLSMMSDEIKLVN